jgi:hypothetical protein
VTHIQGEFLPRGATKGTPLIERHMQALGVPTPVKEHRFATDIGRQWRFDYAWPDLKVAMELEGGTFISGGGRHNRAVGYAGDIEKYNRAAIQGWLVVRATHDMVLEGNAINYLIDAFRARGVIVDVPRRRW